jgi:RHS repeat-associated protein
MKKTNNHNTEYTTRSSIMRFRNLFAGIILFSMLALLTPSALCAVTKQVERYPKFYDSETGKHFAAAMQIKDGDEVFYDFQGTIVAPNGFRGVAVDFVYSTTEEDWVLQSEEEFTITTPGVHKTPMGATVVVQGFIGRNNPYYLGVEMGTRTVGVDLRASIPNVHVGANAQLRLTLIKDGVQYHRRFDIDLGAGENTALFDFDGAFYEDEDGEGEDAEYAEWGSTINQNVSNVSGENEGTDEDCGNEHEEDDDDDTTDDVPCEECDGSGNGGGSGGGNGPRGGGSSGGGGCGGGSTNMVARCDSGHSEPNGGGGGNPQTRISGGSYGSNDQYGPWGISLGTTFSANGFQSAQPRIGGSASSAGENWALDAYQMVHRKQVTIGSDTSMSWRCYKGDNIISIAKELETNHCKFVNSSLTAEFVDSTTLLVSYPGGNKAAFNNLSGDWMRLAYSNMPNGDTVEYHYDGSDCLQYMTYPDNTTTEFQYVSGKIDKIIKRNGDYIKFNLGTTVETIEMYDSSDALLSKSGWEYDSDSKQIKTKYDYTGVNLSTQKAMSTYTFTTVAGASVVATASSEGILTTYDAWDSQPAGSYRTIAYNGVETVTYEKLFSYSAEGYTVVDRTIAASDQTLASVTSTYNKLSMLSHRETEAGKRYYTYQYDTDSSISSFLWGNIISTTDALGRVTNFEYAGTDIISETCRKPISLTSYDANGDFYETRAFVYDATGNVLQAGSKDQNDKWIRYNKNSYTWDANAETYRLAETSDILGYSISYAYDSMGLLAHADIGAVTLPVTNNEKGLLVERTTPEGHELCIDYYDNGRPSAMGIGSATMQYGYGHMQYGHTLTDVTDAKGQLTKFAYDDWGRLVEIALYGDDSILDVSSTTEYDAWGRVSALTDYIGQKEKIYYNALAQATRKEYVNSSDIVTASIVYNYNNDSQMTSIQSYCGGGCADTIYYGYDSTRRPLYRSGVGYGNVGWSYDIVGRINSLQWMKETDMYTSTRCKYDINSQVGAIYADSTIQPLSSYSYDAVGSVDTVLYENGAFTENTYDSTYGRITSMKNKNGSGTVIAGFDYTYDLDGLVTSVTLEDNSYINYTCNNHIRITDEHKKNSSNSTLYRHQYQYDLVGNRTQHIYTDSVSNSTTFTLTYNDLNQLTKREWTYDYTNYDEIYTYDLNGNLTQKQERQEDAEMVVMTQWDYTWDHEDRLIEVVKQTGEGYELSNDKKVQYRYCPSCGGNRTHKIVYDWNSEGMGQGEGEEEEEEEGAWELVKWLRYETLGLNQLRVDEKYDSDQDELDEADPFRTERVTYNGTGQIKQIIKETLYTYSTAYTASNPTKTDVYYHYDCMGVVQALTGSNGLLLTNQRFESDAFGSFDGEATYTTRRITGKEYDEDVELYFFHARWYTPEAVIFISAVNDRISMEHPYSFCGSNPAFFIDPAGTSLVKVDVHPYSKKVFSCFAAGWIGGWVGDNRAKNYPVPGILSDTGRACYEACYGKGAAETALAGCVAGHATAWAGGKAGGLAGGAIGGVIGGAAGGVGAVPGAAAGAAWGSTWGAVAGGIGGAGLGGAAYRDCVYGGDISQSCFDQCEDPIPPGPKGAGRRCQESCKSWEGKPGPWRDCMNRCKTKEGF